MVGCWLELLARLSLSELVQGLLAAGRARGQHRRARDCEATTWAGSGSWGVDRGSMRSEV